MLVTRSASRNEELPHRPLVGKTPRIMSAGTSNALCASSRQKGLTDVPHICDEMESLQRMGLSLLHDNLSLVHPLRGGLCHRRIVLTAAENGVIRLLPATGHCKTLAQGACAWPLAIMTGLDIVAVDVQRPDLVCYLPCTISRPVCKRRW